MAAVARPPLRVGVFCGAAPQPRWIVEALAKAGASPFAEVALVSLPEPGSVPGQTRDRPLVPHGGTQPLLWKAYRQADRTLFGHRAGWEAPADVERIVSRERRVRRAPGSDAWRMRVREARLDVAFAAGDVDDAALEGLARHGVWRFCFGERQDTHEALAAVHEVLEGQPVVFSGIRIRRAGRPDRVAYPSWTRAFPFSIARSRDALFAKTAEFLARALRDLHAGGPDWIERGTEPAPAPAAGAQRLAGSLRDVSLMGARVARRAAEKALTVDEWSIAFRFAGEEPWDGSLAGFHRLNPPRGGYWADPFPIERDGRYYIFFEELPYGAPKAHISVVEVDREGRASAPVKVLERDYHLSYPFLVEEDGQLYMIPETAENQTVEVYRCVEFPAKWKLERVLLRGLRCADATLHREGDRWWMFANAAHAPGADINDELFLFNADRLLGDWQPHRRNPVKSDVRSARPAGRLFRRGGQLYRPGQIGAPLYGSGIALHRVERLTADEYREREEGRIVPRDPSLPTPFGASGGVLGIHTINRAGDLSVTDAFVRRPRFA